MNERIYKIIDQCYEKDKLLNTYQFNKEMFVKLIVQEVLQQVEDEIQYEVDWKLSNIVAKRVKEHFGLNS